MNLAADDDEAAQRFADTRCDDPLPDVPPALLNTSDLVDYVARTGLIHPFTVPGEAERDRTLKPASCAISFAGPVRRWKPSGPEEFELVAEDLKRGQKLKLPRNSITFITLEPYFRFPDYIAGRYNLAIHHIYRGLLVGTGPLVDPGFEGRLSVPVHNLTSQDYELTAGESLVWMELTKLSPHQRWDPRARASDAPFVPFPQRKRDRRTLDDYLAAASPEPIVSSIPVEVGAARVAAEDAAQTARRIQNYNIAGAFAIILAIAGLIWQAVDTVLDEGKDRAALERRVEQLQEKLDQQHDDLTAVDRRARQLARRAARRPRG